MVLRLLLPSLLGASGTFACVSSTRCLPEVQAGPFTLVRGEIDAVLVQEYVLADGCIEVTVDSIVRRAPGTVLEPPANPAISRWGASEGSAAVTVHAHWTRSNPDTTQAELCAKVRIERHVDSIPRSITVYPGPADEPLRKLVPSNPDSVHLCLNGNCARIAPRTVQNGSTPGPCISANPRSFSTAAEARDFLLERFASRPLKPRILTRAISVSDVIYGSVSVVVDEGSDTLPLGSQVVQQGIAVHGPGFVDSRLSYLGDFHPSMPPVSPWNDPSIPPRLALPSSANAGDLFGPETLDFHVEALEGDLAPYQVRYATGVLLYAYLGHTRDGVPNRLTPYASRPRLIGDSLRLQGLGVVLTDRATCPVAGQDVFAAKYNRWLYYPSEDGPFQEDFTHTYSAENEQSWPIVGDTVLVGGQKVPLAWLQSNVSVGPGTRRAASFAVRRIGSELELNLERAGEVRLATATGRILSSRLQPEGTSRLALPRGHRGILLVQVEGRTLRVLAP